MAISTVSFTNTPQAVDDYYTATQTGLTENSTETIVLAVMANDLGGKAKTLYSLDDGIENEGSATSADLLMKDLVGVNNLSQYGAHIAIMADGTVAYTMTDTSRAHFASLGAGEIGYDSFTYAIRLGNGTLSWATATVEIRGVNDAPLITSSAQTGAVSEDGTLGAAGQVTASDVDDGATLSFSGNASSAYGSFAVDATTGEWTYSLDNAAAQSLAAGQEVSETFTVTVTDDQGATATQDVTITITGTNDAPLITSSAQTGAVSEDATLGAAGQVTASNVDDGATLSFSGNASSAYGSFAVDATTGEWTYSLDNAAAQSLAAGQEVSETFTVTVTDDQGATATQDVTITITGTNDAPTASDGSASTDEDTPILTGSLPAASDIEGDTVTYTLGSTSPSNGTVVVYADGTFDYTPNANFNGEDNFSFVVDDGNGGSNEYNYSLTINAVNDAPLVNATGTLNYTENQAASVINSTLTVSDADSPLLDGATVSISGNFHAGEDVLGFSNQNGITGSYNAVTGVLTLSGTASLANYQAALRSVTYFNASENPSGDTRTISFQVDDGALLSNIATSSVAVAPMEDGPSIIANSQVNYSTQNSNGEVAFINGFRFEDADSGSSSVTVTINTNITGDALNALTGNGVTVAGAGSSILTLTGTIADINAFIAGDQIRWDPQGNNSPSQDFTISIDDNGVLAGGNLASTTLRYASTQSNSLGLTVTANLVSFAGWSLNAINANAGNGSDTITTTWHHGPSATAVSYVGGQPNSGSPGDSITLAFSVGQLDEILGNSTFRSALSSYLDGSPTGGSLDLGTSSWNATVAGFETANLALASGNDGIITYAAIGSTLPSYLAGLIGDGGDNLLVGSAAGESLLGDSGNDILVGLGGNDLLLGGMGSDLLLGGAGNDKLNGGTGNDILSGGSGADTFAFSETGALNVDAIIDYSYVEGDKLDLSALLNANFDFGKGSQVADFVQLVQVDSSITVQVDVDGAANGASFADVAVLTNYGTTGSDLVRAWFGDVDHTLAV
jgi:VCBS repeat-containing protein